MAIQYCRHIKVNGERCGSPALANNIFCFFHVEFDRRHRRCTSRRSEAATILHPMSLQDGSQRDPLLAEPINSFSELELPPLEDRHSIQVALSLVITALAQNRVDPKLATLLFYGLQVASSNARLLNPVKRDPGKVSLTVLDETNGSLIAPEGDPEEVMQDLEQHSPTMRKWFEDVLDMREDDRRQVEARTTLENQ